MGVGIIFLTPDNNTLIILFGKQSIKLAETNSDHVNRITYTDFCELYPVKQFLSALL